MYRARRRPSVVGKPVDIEGDHMPRYVVERTFAERLELGPSVEDRCREIVERNGEEVTWLHSYVSDDGRKLYCMYEAPNPEAIRKSAVRNALPVDSITAVRVLAPHPYTEP
jgi:Protein of unknown function (DUF4242)